MLSTSIPALIALPPSPSRVLWIIGAIFSSNFTVNIEKYYTVEIYTCIMMQVTPHCFHSYRQQLPSDKSFSDRPAIPWTKPQHSWAHRWHVPFICSTLPWDNACTGTCPAQHKRRYGLLKKRTKPTKSSEYTFFTCCDLHYCIALIRDSKHAKTRKSNTRKKCVTFLWYYWLHVVHPLD